MSLCIGLGCGTIVAAGQLTCGRHAGLVAPPPDCPDGHGALAFVVVSAVRLGGVLSLMWACPLCDYVTTTDYPPATRPAPDRARRSGGAS